MSVMDHEEVRASLGAYVLGAMPPEEIAEVRSHILSCESCMQEADELAEAAASFSLSAGTAPLPPGFADEVLRSARGESVEVPLVAKRSRVSRWRLAAGVAAAVITVAAVGVAIDTRADLARNQRILTAVLHEEGLELRGTPGAVGKVVSIGGRATFAATGLQQAPRGHDYQLWLIRDGLPQSAGVFDVDGGIAVLESDLSLEGYEAAAVTIEPDGGLDQPSGDPVLTSS